MEAIHHIISRQFSEQGRENYDNIKWDDDEEHIEETIYDVNKAKKAKGKE